MEIKVDTTQHIKALTQNLNEMREAKENCDFVIRIGTEEIFAHKYVLSAGSDYFKAMLIHDTKEKQTDDVAMKDVEPKCVRKCIDFIYTGIPPKVDDDIEQLMYVANLMQLTRLCKGIEELLEDTLHPDTFFITWKLANLYDLRRLIEKCVEFAVEHFEVISKDDDFVHFDKKYIKKILKSKNSTMSEESKLYAMMRWLKFESESREKFMDELLKFITLSDVPVFYLRHLIKNESLINENSKRVTMFSLCVMDRMAAEIESYKERIVMFDKNSGYLQMLNPTENTLTQTHKMNNDMTKEFFSAVCVCNYIYVLMQNKSVHRISYSDKASIWEQVENFVDDHGRPPPVTTLKNCIYVIGGCDVCLTKAVEKFDTISNKWMKLPDKPQASQYSEPVVLNDQIYCCGGYVSGKYTNIVNRFDQESSEWTTVAPMNEKKACVAAVEYGGKLYILGGYATEKSNVKHFTTVESYDPQVNSWTLCTNSINIPRSFFRSFEINGEIYAVGGYNTSPNSIEKYNFTKNEWKEFEIPADRKLTILESVKVKI